MNLTARRMVAAEVALPDVKKVTKDLPGVKKVDVTSLYPYVNKVFGGKW